MGTVLQILASPELRGFCLIVGFVVALTSIHTSHLIARRKQAADALFASRNDEILQAGLGCIRNLHDAKNENIRAIVESDSEEHKKKFNLVLYVLNYYEFLAVGIKNKIYDEKIIREAQYTIVKNLHIRTLPFILTVRDVYGSETLFQEFCWLVNRWKKKKLRANGQ